MGAGVYLNELTRRELHGVASSIFFPLLSRSRICPGVLVYLRHGALQFQLSFLVWSSSSLRPILITYSRLTLLGTPHQLLQVVRFYTMRVPRRAHTRETKFPSSCQLIKSTNNVTSTILGALVEAPNIVFHRAETAPLYGWGLAPSRRRRRRKPALGDFRVGNIRVGHMASRQRTGTCIVVLVNSMHGSWAGLLLQDRNAVDVCTLTTNYKHNSGPKSQSFSYII